MLLRGHHLVCLHYYHGEGYDQNFIDYLQEMMNQTRNGATVEVVEGPDHLCLACCHLSGVTCASEANAEVEVRTLDKKALDFLGVQHGDKVTWKEIATRLQSTPVGWFDDYCRDCTWSDKCDRKKKTP